MQHLYSNCVPKLNYGAAVKDMNASEKNQFNVAVNNAVRRGVYQGASGASRDAPGVGL